MASQHLRWETRKQDLERRTVVLPKPNLTCDAPPLGHTVHLTEASAAQTSACQANTYWELEKLKSVGGRTRLII